MRKEHFFDKYRHQQLAQQELERKWRIFREQEELQTLYEATQRIESRKGDGSIGLGGSIITDNTINDFVEGGYVEDYFE
jgi:hypothetical protein